MTKYEYKVETINWTQPELEGRINALAKSGWRLVAAMCCRNYYIYERDSAEGSV